jgi:putative ABC transport system ATP-binding protein
MEPAEEIKRDEFALHVGAERAQILGQH